MALTKAQIIAQIDSLLASAKVGGITAANHRDSMYDTIDKIYDENIDGVSLVGTDLVFTRDGGTGTSITVDMSSFIQDLSGLEPLRGADDNYVTDAQLAVIVATSGINSGDQDLSGLAPLSGATLVGASINGVTPSALGGGTQFLSDDGTYKAPAGGGDVVGPGVAVDNDIAVFDGTTGKLIKNGGLALSELATAAQGALADTAVQPAAIADFETTTELNARDTANRDTDNHTSGTTNKVYTATEQSKLSGIEAGADVTDATNVAAAGAAMKSTAQTDWISGFWEAPTDKSYTIALKARFAGTITEVTTICVSGTCTATVKINTTALGGTANSVSSTESSQTHSTANTFAIGDDIVVTISANSSCTDMALSVKFTYNLA